MGDCWVPVWQSLKSGAKVSKVLHYQVGSQHTIVELSPVVRCLVTPSHVASLRALRLLRTVGVIRACHDTWDHTKKWQSCDGLEQHDEDDNE